MQPCASTGENGTAARIAEDAVSVSTCERDQDASTAVVRISVSTNSFGIFAETARRKGQEEEACVFTPIKNSIVGYAKAFDSAVTTSKSDFVRSAESRACAGIIRRNAHAKIAGRKASAATRSGGRIAPNVRRSVLNLSTDQQLS